MTEPRTLSSAAMVRLVAAREVSARIRDKNFIISTVFILVLLVGMLGFQVAMNAGGEQARVGVVGGTPEVTAALEAQGTVLDVDVEVQELADDAAARAAIEEDEVDGVLVTGGGQEPELLVEQSAGGSLQTVVQGAVSQLAVAEQLAEAGLTGLDVPEVSVTALDPDADEDGQRVIVAIIGVAVLYSLLIMFGQFVAQGVVEEKASRVVELLLATMKPWQLLAGKLLGLGLLGLAQIVAIAVVGVAGALAFDLVDIPGDLIGTAVSVVVWFVLGFAFYAAIFAVAGSLVSRQEDLGTVTTPTTLLLVVAVIVGVQGAANPDGTLAVVTSFVPGLSPMVMPVRQAAGDVAVWEIGLSALIAVLAVALVIRIGGRVYAASLLRTSGRTKFREALRSERV